MGKNTDQTKLYDPSTLGFAIGRVFLKSATYVLFLMGLISVFKHPDNLMGLYLLMLGWFAYFAAKLLSPRLVPDPPKGE